MFIGLTIVDGADMFLHVRGKNTGSETTYSLVPNHPTNKGIQKKKRCKSTISQIRQKYLWSLHLPDILNLVISS